MEAKARPAWTVGRQTQPVAAVGTLSSSRPRDELPRPRTGGQDPEQENNKLVYVIPPRGRDCAAAGAGVRAA